MGLGLERKEAHEAQSVAVNCEWGSTSEERLNRVGGYMETRKLGSVLSSLLWVLQFPLYWILPGRCEKGARWLSYFGVFIRIIRNHLPETQIQVRFWFYLLCSQNALIENLKKMFSLKGPDLYYFPCH